MKKILILLCFLLTLGDFTMAADRLTGEMFATRSEVIAKNAMVATSQPLAVQVGIDILKKGGNAIDAAIAVDAALGLMEPVSSGIGGDLFAIVWVNKEKKLYGLNASGTAPKAISIDYFKSKGIKQIPYYGPLSWTVPGCVDGWFQLNKHFGKLPMKELLAPAIKYAREGFPISEVIAYQWKDGLELFHDYENFQKLYSINGRAPSKGDIFINKELADTYELIANKGRDAYYKGDIAKTIVNYSKRVGGFFELDDFSNYHSEWVTPLSTDYKGFRVWELPPNTQGLAVLQMLNMLKYFDLKSMGHNSADYLHTLIEIKKIVYEDRAKYYADPKFAQIPIDKLLSDDYAKEQLKKFNKEKAIKQIIDEGNNEKTVYLNDRNINNLMNKDIFGVGVNNFEKNSFKNEININQDTNVEYNNNLYTLGDTAYMTVADEEGNMISFIQSNFSGFGSGMVPDGLGFCIQDRGALFNLDPNHLNSLQPGKRPFHTIIPGFMTKNNKPVFSFGVMGGDMQPQGHIQILMNILEFGMNVQEAGDAARFYHEGSSGPNGGIMTDGGTVYLESGISPQVIRELLERGHKIGKTIGVYGGYQGIWKDNDRNIYIGGSESRKDGEAIGY
jgi:gamma-glutamyltranspeptidase/glutathione hydrolase